MEDKKNQQGKNSGRSMQEQDRNSNESGQQENMNKGQDENAQDGRQWNNYQTREMGGNVKDAEGDNSTMGNP